jgi:hypothetical protein
MAGQSAERQNLFFWWYIVVQLLRIKEAEGLCFLKANSLSNKSENDYSY